jgi:hypothetical protein
MTVAAMLASSLAFAGGVLLTSAGPASALAGGGQTCTSLSTTLDLGSGSVSGTISGCNSPGHNPGTIVLSIASGGGSIFWASGKATSLLQITSEQIGVGDCSSVNSPDPQLPVTVGLTVLNGPFVGTSGGGVLCVDVITLASVVNGGPITL